MNREGGGLLELGEGTAKVREQLKLGERTAVVKGRNSWSKEKEQLELPGGKSLSWEGTAWDD